MKLIGAGLPRTATLSQKIALEMLGLGPCYHMVTVLSNLSLADQWQAEFIEGSGHFDEIFDGYRATVDWPGSFFYRELCDFYPDAKVLLSTRDGASWEQSMTNTIWGVLYGDTLIQDLSSAWSRVDPAWDSYIQLMKNMWEKSGLMSAGDDAPGSMARAMERYNAEVIATVPPERLLVWSAGDGFGPLCEFLELPVPDAPFPHVNDSKMFAERIVASSLASLTTWHAEESATAEKV